MPHGLAERRLLSLMLTNNGARRRALDLLGGRNLEALGSGPVIEAIARLTESGEEVSHLRLYDELPEGGEERRLLAEISADPAAGGGGPSPRT